MTLMQRLAFVFLLFLAACENASDTVVAIPNVNIQCESTSNVSCDASVDGNDAFVVMTRSGCGSSQDFESVASGSVSLSCDSSGCSGTVSSWQKSGSGVTEIISGRMDLCSRIDIGANDAEETSGDLIDESSENIQSGESLTVDSWSEI